MRRTQLMWLVAVLSSLVIPMPARAAGTGIYMKIEATKQGTLKGDVKRVAGDNYIAVEGFNYEVASPIDSATGQITGKRQHKPLTITKKLDATSPQIYEAAVNNEVLKTVTIEFTTTTTDSKELTYYTITLTNASVTDVHQRTRSTVATGAPGGPATIDMVEDISFSFQKIEEQDTEGRTASSDDWADANK